jgi:hypothetical protein
LLIVAVVAFVRGVEGVVRRSLQVMQALVAEVRRLGVEGVVPEQGEDLDLAGMLEENHTPLGLDLDLDHNLLAGHLGEAGHYLPAGHSLSGGHILQEVDLDQAGNFLEGGHSLQVGDLVELALIVN